jgi:cytochrome c553
MRTITRLLIVAAGLVAVAAAGEAGAGPVDARGYTKAFACSACHGFGGASRADAMPILAGMWPEYFRKTIQDYAAGRRPSPEMEPFAKMVVAAGLDDVAAYFASQPFVPAAAPTDAAAVARGQAAAARCRTCHGSAGQGDRARVIPPLRGQPAGYLRQQILLFKQDARSPGDAALREMKAIMRDVPDATAADLAAYYSSLR